MIPHPDFDDGQGPYVANVAELDYRTGQILDALEAAGVAEDTIAVWASDNAAAEIMGGSSGAWRGKFGGGWEGSIRTPAMIRWPGRVPSNTETDEIVATYDWMPTLAAMVGRSDLMPTDRPIDGIDMSTFVLGDTESSGRDHFAFLGSDGQPVSVKWKTMKVHFRLATSDSWTAPLETPQIPAIYDLAVDPAETKDLMDTELSVAWVIRAAMAPLVELKQSATQYPHITPGADFDGYA
jgi:arylsulfatase A-like enzyme